MRYFTFRDKNRFSYSKEKIWKSVLNIHQWPHSWKNVYSIQINNTTEVKQFAQIHCHLILLHLIHLHFDVYIHRLKKETYANFSFTGDFTGQGRWILKTQGSDSISLLHLHLQPHHPFLRIISFLPLGRRLLLYSHQRVMAEGKKMILKRLLHD